MAILLLGALSSKESLYVIEWFIRGGRHRFSWHRRQHVLPMIRHRVSKLFKSCVRSLVQRFDKHLWAAIEPLSPQGACFEHRLNGELAGRFWRLQLFKSRELGRSWSSPFSKSGKLRENLPTPQLRNVVPSVPQNPLSPSMKVTELSQEPVFPSSS